MNKIFLVFLLINPLFFPVLPTKSGTEEQKNAAIMILAACTWSQLGQIPRSKIIETAKMGYQKTHGSTRKVDWDKAISLAEKLDKVENHGCFK